MLPDYLAIPDELAHLGVHDPDVSPALSLIHVLAGDDGLPYYNQATSPHLDLRAR